jgi:hypothetical protein
LNFRGILCEDIPHDYFAVSSCTRHVPPILAQSNSPDHPDYLATGIHLAQQTPFRRVWSCLPDLDFTSKPRASGYLAISGGADMVASDVVSAADGLYERERRGGGVMDVYGVGAARRQ